MAWLLDVFQIGSLVVFVLLFTGRTVYLRVVRGINPIRVSRGKPLGEALLESLLVVALPIWLYEAFAFAWPLPWHLFPEPLNVVVLDAPVARVAGCLLIIGGITLFAAALFSFGDSWRVGIDRETPGELVTEGVFAFTRNPIFLFMDTYALGTFLLNGRLLFGLFAVLAFVAIHFQILREERFLAGRYDQVYRAYRRRTPRYFGVVR
jgi:protein-S-isoprenylcysteine O-methyltransferase Ste14